MRGKQTHVPLFGAKRRLELTRAYRDDSLSTHRAAHTPHATPRARETRSTHGRGRVFYTAWGHDDATWAADAFHELVGRGVRWAAAGSLVTVSGMPSPTAPPADEHVATKPLLPQDVPPIGLGTGGLKGEACRRAVTLALEAGYRHVDSAEQCNIPRPPHTVPPDLLCYSCVCTQCAT